MIEIDPETLVSKTDKLLWLILQELKRLTPVCPTRKEKPPRKPPSKKKPAARPKKRVKKEGV